MNISNKSKRINIQFFVVKSCSNNAFYHRDRSSTLLCVCRFMFNVEAWIGYKTSIIITSIVVVLDVQQQSTFCSIRRFLIQRFVEVYVLKQSTRYGMICNSNVMQQSTLCNSNVLQQSKLCNSNVLQQATLCNSNVLQQSMLCNSNVLQQSTLCNSNVLQQLTLCSTKRFAAVDTMQFQRFVVFVSQLVQFSL